VKSYCLPLSKGPFPLTGKNDGKGSGVVGHQLNGRLQCQSIQCVSEGLTS